MTGKVQVGNTKVPWDDDYSRMQALLSTCNRLAVIPSYLTPGDLDWWRVLIMAGCRHLKRLGAKTAIVDARSEDLAPNKLYESCGFKEIGRFHPWKKRLD